MFCKKSVLKYLPNVTGKHLCWSLFFNEVAGLHLCWSLFLVTLQTATLFKKDSNTGAGLQLYYKKTPTEVLYCEIYEIFKNTYFKEHLRTTASESA